MVEARVDGDGPPAVQAGAHAVLGLRAMSSVGAIVMAVGVFLLAQMTITTSLLEAAIFMVIAMWIFPEAGVKKGDIKK